jgi:transaldolase
VKLFLATDVLEDVHWAAARGWCDGVVLPDDALRSASSPDAAVEWLAAFARAVPMPVFVDGSDAHGIGDDPEAHLRALARAGEQVVLQLPFDAASAARLRGLSQAGVQVAASFIGTAAQALLAAKAGAAHVLLDADRLDALNGGGAEVIRAARTLLDAAGLEADLVALFPSGAASLAACGVAGADAAVVGASALRAMLASPFSDQALTSRDHRSGAGRRRRAGDA